MADIIYTYKNEVYANITNKCDCACTFCIRSQKDAIGNANINYGIRWTQHMMR